MQKNFAIIAHDGRGSKIEVSFPEEELKLFLSEGVVYGVNASMRIEGEPSLSEKELDLLVRSTAQRLRV